MKRRQLWKPVLILICLATLTGCHDEVNEVAREAADRQAAQNTEMMRLNREVAHGVEQMVTSDAASRRDLLAAQQQLQTYAGELAHQFERLEEQRAEYSRERYRTLNLTDALRGSGALLAGILALAIVRQLLATARQDEGGWLLAEEYLLAATENRSACLPTDASVQPKNLLESRS